MQLGDTLCNLNKFKKVKRSVWEKERAGCTAMSPPVLGVLPTSPDAQLLRAGFDSHGKFGN